MEKTRNTSQRLKIYGYLNSARTHPNAEEVYNAVAKELPAITLATVYRNLNLLAEQGQILRLKINNEYRYDADISFHQHCVCKKCGRVIDLFRKEISRYALSKFNLKGFSAESVNIIFNGICSKCS